MEVDTIKTAD